MSGPADVMRGLAGLKEDLDELVARHGRLRRDHLALIEAVRDGLAVTGHRLEMPAIGHGVVPRCSCGHLLDDERASEAYIAHALAELKLLSPHHYVIFDRERWTMEHSLACRMGGTMAACTVHKLVSEWFEGGWPTPSGGRWRITDWTGEDRDRPVLELVT